MVSKKQRLIPATSQARDAAIHLLRENNLPVSDLDEAKHLFVLKENNEVVGTGGLEFFHTCALLRSIAVAKQLQGAGIGKTISGQLEEIARQKGIEDLYLLTNTAENFFKKQGYEAISRNDVPGDIRTTSEFSMVACASAIVMRKKIQ